MKRAHLRFMPALALASLLGTACGHGPSAPTAHDPFGVTELYPTRSGGETWFLGSDPTHDPRFDPQEPITQNPDGSWKITGPKVRMEVFTSSGYHPKQIASYDRDTLATQGYMQDPHDWKNVEITGFVRVNATSDLEHGISWYSRGGTHSQSVPCEGSSYKGDIRYDGRTRWQKESWHVDYNQWPDHRTTRSVVGRWIGLKAVMRNVTVNGEPAVHLELWLDDSGDKVSWEKVYDVVDDGSVFGNATHCGASHDKMPMTWGGPITAFRWDSATDVDFKWLSVREIE